MIKRIGELTVVVFIFVSILFSQPHIVPGIYRSSPFVEGNNAGYAAPFLFANSTVLQYNASISPFIKDDDFSVSYKSYFLPDMFTGGISYVKALNEMFYTGGYFYLLMAQNIMNIEKGGEFRNLTTYQTFLYEPSLAYKINKNITTAAETLFLYREFVGVKRYVVNLGLSGSYLYNKFLYFGLSIKNLISSFLENDAPFSINNSIGAHLLDGQLSISGGSTYRLIDSYFGYSFGVKSTLYNIFEIYGGYNNNQITVGSSISYRSIRLAYTLNTGFLNNNLDKTINSMEHIFEINIFNKLSEYRPVYSSAGGDPEIKKLMIKADSYYSEKKYLDAISLWESILKKDKENIEAREKIKNTKRLLKPYKEELIRQGAQANEEGEYLSAIKTYVEVLRYDNNNQEVKEQLIILRSSIDEDKSKYYLFAELYYKKKNYPKALENIDNVLYIDENYNAAKKFKEKIVKSQTEEQERIENEKAGNDLISQGRIQLGNNNFEKALELFNNSLEYLEDKSEAQILIRKTEKYIQDAEKHENASISYVAGVDAIEKGKIIDGIKYLQEALEIYPDFEEARIKLKEVSQNMQTQIDENLKLGLQAFEQGNYKTANVKWNNVLQIDPENSLAIKYLELLKREKTDKFDLMKEAAKIAIEKGNYNLVKENYENALAINPNNKEIAEALNNINLKIAERNHEILIKGQGLFDDKKYDEAKSIFTQLLTYDKNNQAALDYMDKIKTINNLSSLYLEALTLLENRRFEKSLEIFAKISTIDPNYKDIKKKLDEATKQVNELNREDKLLTMFEEGAESFKYRKYNEAIQKWEQVRELDPENALVKEYIEIARIKAEEQQNINYNNALAAIKKEDWYTARIELAKTLQSNPDNENVKNKLNNVNFQINKLIKNLNKDADEDFKNGNYDSALFRYKEIFKYDESDYKTEEKILSTELAIEYKKTGETAEMNNDDVSALTAYKEVISLNPDDRSIIEKSGRLMAKIEENKEKNIKEGYTLLEQKKYYNALKRWEIILPLLEGGQKDEILGQIKSITQIIDNIKKENIQIAKKQSAGKQYKEAVASYKRVLEVDPNNLEVRRELKNIQREYDIVMQSAKEKQDEKIRILYAEGIEYYKQQKYKEAIAAWEKVLRLDPDNIKAKDYIGRAKAKLELLGE